MTEACDGKARSSCVAVIMGSDFDSTISPDDDNTDSGNIKIIALEIILGRFRVFCFNQKSQYFFMKFFANFFNKQISY